MSKETIEEAATRLANDHCNIRITPHTTEFQVQQLIIKGAAWQAKRMYSEEEIERAFYEGVKSKVTFNEWFNQFKKQKS